MSKNGEFFAKTIFLSEAPLIKYNRRFMDFCIMHFSIDPIRYLLMVVMSCDVNGWMANVS